MLAIGQRIWAVRLWKDQHGTPTAWRVEEGAVVSFNGYVVCHADPATGRVAFSSRSHVFDSLEDARRGAADLGRRDGVPTG